LALIGILSLSLSPAPAALKILVSPVLLFATFRQVRRVALLKTTRAIVALGLRDSRREGEVDVYLGIDHRKPVPCRVVQSHVSRNLVIARLTAAIGSQNHDLFLVRPMCGREEFSVLKRYLLSLKN